MSVSNAVVAIVRWNVITTIKKFIIVALVLVVAVFGTLYAAYAVGVRAVVTASVPRGIYLMQPNRAIRRGSLVFACPPEPFASSERSKIIGTGPCKPANTMTIVKHVAGVPGDRVELTLERVRINGKALANSKTFPSDSRGRPLLRIARGTYLLHGDQLWLAGRPLRSWDSRYFGPVSIASAAVAIATPLYLVDRAESERE